MHLKKRVIPFFFAAAFACLSAFCAQALVSDDASLIEGAKLCTRYLPRHERDFGIPEHLLAAIASTESGRYNHALGMNLPWPWTINVEGRGYFFDTKQQAISAVQSLQARGVQSIDVGCMQVNLHHHPYAFANLDQAFDPAYNVGYAAQFLKQNFELENGSWRKATADYHSHSLIFGEPYARLVYSAWSRIINKVADARAGRPVLVASAPHVFGHFPVYHAPRIHMHSISVASDETTREHGVLVIRPQSAPDSSMQQVSEDEAFVNGRIDADTGDKQPTLRQHASGSDNSIKVADADTSTDSKGPQIVRIHSVGSSAANAIIVPTVNATAPAIATVAKGQFQPNTHIVHDGGDSGTSSQASDSKPAPNPFVFDN
jgi:hypothetical protein